MQTTEIHFNWIKVALILILIIGCSIFCFHLLAHPDEWISHRYRSLTFIFIAGLVSFIFCGICFLFLLSILLRRKTAITIDTKGITEYTNINSIGLIEWKDIKAIKAGKVKSNNFLLIEVKNNRKYVALSKNILQTLVMKGYVNLSGTPFFLSAGLLNCNFNELSKIVLEAYNEYKDK